VRGQGGFISYYIIYTRIHGRDRPSPCRNLGWDLCGRDHVLKVQFHIFRWLVLGTLYCVYRIFPPFLVDVKMTISVSTHSILWREWSYTTWQCQRWKSASLHFCITLFRPCFRFSSNELITIYCGKVQFVLISWIEYYGGTWLNLGLVQICGGMRETGSSKWRKTNVYCVSDEFPNPMHSHMTTSMEHVPKCGRDTQVLELISLNPASRLTSKFSLHRPWFLV